MMWSSCNCVVWTEPIESYLCGFQENGECQCKGLYTRSDKCRGFSSWMPWLVICLLLIYRLFIGKNLFLYAWVSAETFPSIGRVRVKHRGILLTLKGTVIRTSAIKMIEGEKIYECRVCKHRSDLCAFIPWFLLDYLLSEVIITNHVEVIHSKPYIIILVFWDRKDIKHLYPFLLQTCASFMLSLGICIKKLDA